jgi:hypothetical protein
VIIDTRNTFLYFVLNNAQAMPIRSGSGCRPAASKGVPARFDRCAKVGAADRLYAVVKRHMYLAVSLLQRSER